jgi:hypothetical protein
MTTFIVTSPKADLEALRYQGIVVSESWTQIKSSLEKHLTARHAAIFAIPYAAGDGSTIDWYSETAGPVIAWADLSAARRQQALDTLKTLAAEISVMSREMQNSQDEASITRGHIITLALRYPAMENIFMAGEQPLLTCWGFIGASGHSQPEDLLRAGLAPRETPLSSLAAESAPPARPAEAEPSPPLAAAPPDSARADKKEHFNPLLLLPLLLSLLLTLALFYALSLIPGCSSQDLWRGCSPRGGDAASSAPAQSAPTQSAPAQSVPPAAAAPEPPGVSPASNRELAELTRHEQELHTRLQELRLRLLQRADQCRVTPPAPQETPKPPSLADMLPQTPETPETPETPQPQAIKPETDPPARPEIVSPARLAPEEEIKPALKPETEPAPRTDPDTELVIPEGAREKNDMSFLQGCWVSSSHIYNDETREQVTVEYCFDQDGRGSRIMRESDGRRCAGPAQTSFNDSGRLIIDSGAADCDNGASYVPQRVECSGSGDSTDCQGAELDEQGLKWQARFRRQ